MNYIFRRIQPTAPSSSSLSKLFITVWTAISPDYREIRFNFLSIPTAETDAVWKDLQSRIQTKCGFQIPAMNDHLQVVIVVDITTLGMIRTDLRTLNIQWNEYT